MSTLFEQIRYCMRRDQLPFKKRLQSITSQPPANTSSALKKLTKDIERSSQRRQRRSEIRPEITFPEHLPISQQRQKIADTISQHQVVVLSGETGSGKTTQLAKICLTMGRGTYGMIGHTQPRRIAAHAVACRIADELHVEVGREVGYQVRYSDRVSENSLIKIMTDGILLAELQNDRFFNAYDTLIIDEAHERSLNIDFLLGYLRRILPKRPDLKIIITSATIDPDSFSRFFNNAPIISVSGRVYPVEVRYRPIAGEDEESQDNQLQESLCASVHEAMQSTRGDCLIFQSGERDIRETAKTLRELNLPGIEVLPLFARLSFQEQQKVFAKSKHRRIILATNVAETSITLPGITTIIDPGFVRMSRYSPQAKVQRLPIERISKASAMQRQGRSGRTGPGLCIRLYSEQTFEQLSDYTTPEIQRTSLAAVILQMKALGLGNINDFIFIDPPIQKYITDGFNLLHELNALDASNNLTPLGRQLARLPVDPRVARMLLAAKQEHCLTEILIIASALSIADPRERPLDRQQAADTAHQPFSDERSDFLSWLKLWTFYHDHAKHLSRNQLKKFCHQHFLSNMRMRQWLDIHNQLMALMHGMGTNSNQEAAEYPNIHRALLAGLLGHIGQYDRDRDYIGPRQLNFQLFPGSGLVRKRPQWIMAAELAETTKLYARTVATIEPIWLEDLAQHLIKHHYYDPHWEKKAGHVVAFERLTLYGLIINPKRSVNFAKIDPIQARTIFIRDALVTGNVNTRAAFARNNKKLIATIESLEHKTRRQDILIDETLLFAFFDSRLPTDICNISSVETWLKTQNDPRILEFSEDDLVARQTDDDIASQFPDSLMINGIAFKLVYHFDPVGEHDGINCMIPIATLNQLETWPFEWLVPGLIREKIIALLRTLPKQLRKAFVPIPQFVDALLENITFQQGPLLAIITHELRRMTGVELPHNVWAVNAVEKHLLMNFCLVDEQGKTVATGRDLEHLRQKQGETAHQVFQELSTDFIERDDICTWDFGSLPQQIVVNKKGYHITGFPTLIDGQNKLSLRLLDVQAKASWETRFGLARLFLLQIAKEVRNASKNLPQKRQLCLYYATLPQNQNPARSNLTQCEQITDDIMLLAALRVFPAAPLHELSSEIFAAIVAAAKPGFGAAANAIAQFLNNVLQQYNQIQSQIKRFNPAVYGATIAEVNTHLSKLVYHGFLLTTPENHLQHLPRYLQAIERRLNKLDGNYQRDILLLEQITPLWQQFSNMSQHIKSKQLPEALETYRWMLEEFRVSLFAQDLKTAIPISLKRLAKQWLKCETIAK